ncbi:MAG: hypothetical protein Q8M94_22765 [Ignavibacteria bacterium]|nr:hypothetical protein [Ignavibacteria bacterium]
MNSISDERIGVMMQEYYKKGLIEGIKRYAWMKDGVTYVGTTGTTQKKALEEIEKEIPRKEGGT